MATAAFTAAGTTLGVSASAPATYDAAGYAALTFTDIGEIVDFGEFGRVYNEVTHNPVGDRATYKFKGSYNDGNLQLQLAKAPADAGQVLLLAALNSDSNYHFEVAFNDNPGGSTNTIIYFSGKVMSAPDQVGSVDSIVGKTINISIDGSTIEVAATS